MFVGQIDNAQYIYFNFFIIIFSMWSYILQLIYLGGSSPAQNALFYGFL